MNEGEIVVKMKMTKKLKWFSSMWKLFQEQRTGLSDSHPVLGVTEFREKSWIVAGILIFVS